MSRLMSVKDTNQRSPRPNKEQQPWRTIGEWHTLRSTSRPATAAQERQSYTDLAPGLGRTSHKGRQNGLWPAGGMLAEF